LLLFFVVRRSRFLERTLSKSFDNVHYFFDRLDDYSFCVIVEHYEQYCKDNTSENSGDELQSGLLLLGSPDRQASIGNQEFTALALVIQTEFRTVSYQLHLLCSPRAIIANVEARTLICLRPERR
jgi:hypothetical protein